MNYLLSLLSALLFMNGGSERFWKHLSFKKYFNLIKPMLCMCNTYVTFWAVKQLIFIIFLISLLWQLCFWSWAPCTCHIMLPTSGDDSQWCQHFLKVLLIRIFIWSLPTFFSIKTFAAFYDNKLSREITEAWQFFGRFER